MRPSTCLFLLLEPQVLFRLPVLLYCYAVHTKWRAIIRLEGVWDKSDRYYHPKTPFRLNLINSTFITHHWSAVYAGRRAESMSERFALMSLWTDRTVSCLCLLNLSDLVAVEGQNVLILAIYHLSLGWFIIIRWVLTELLQEQTTPGRFSHNAWVIIGFGAWSNF